MTKKYNSFKEKGKERPIVVVRKMGRYTYIGPIQDDLMFILKDGRKLTRRFENYNDAVAYAKERGYKVNEDKE